MAEKADDRASARAALWIAALVSQQCAGQKSIN